MTNGWREDRDLRALNRGRRDRTAWRDLLPGIVLLVGVTIWSAVGVFVGVWVATKIIAAIHGMIE